MVKNATVSLPPPLDEVGKKREMKINDRETKEKIKKEKDELDEKDSAQHKTLKEWIDEARKHSKNVTLQQKHQKNAEQKTTHVEKQPRVRI